uniref:Uncharacterized protein n=1 Tax=Vitis vinifera TaxID=29760 RepID=F6H515_VITVI
MSLFRFLENPPLLGRLFIKWHLVFMTILPDLENLVNEQVSSQTYSLDANLCLLRLYQFEPERMSTQIVAQILVKALMAMPAPDFSLSLFNSRTSANGGIVLRLRLFSHIIWRQQGSVSSGMKQLRIDT